VIRKKPSSRELEPQRHGVGELDRVEPEGGRRVDVGRGSSMKSAAAGSMPNRSVRRSKIRRSGFATPTSPEMTIPSNQARKANRSRATGNISADQLLSASSLRPAARRSASTSTVPGISPASISGQRPWKASISSRRSGCSTTRRSIASAQGRPASWWAFHSVVVTSARKDSISSGSSKSFR
jgi:hypothetical protein